MFMRMAASILLDAYVRTRQTEFKYKHQTKNQLRIMKLTKNPFWSRWKKYNETSSKIQWKENQGGLYCQTANKHYSKHHALHTYKHYSKHHALHTCMQTRVIYRNKIWIKSCG